MSSNGMPIPDVVPLQHTARHIFLSLHVDETGKKSVNMVYKREGFPDEEFHGRGPHHKHDPIQIWKTDQDTIVWESETGPFVIELKDENPFYRPFPANSALGRDDVHRVSSGPARDDEVGGGREIHFLARFTGIHASAEPLDPHLATFP